MKKITDLFKKAYGGIPVQIWWLALATLINRSGTMVILFLSLYLTDYLHMPVQRAGVIMAIFGAGSFCGVFISGRFTDKLGYYPVILFSLFGGALMFFLVSLVTQYWVMCICTFIMSCTVEAFRPPMMTAVATFSTPGTYTRSISLNRLAINLGFSIGPLLGGWLALINYRAIFWADGITCLGAGLIILFFLGNKSPAPHEQNKQEDGKASSAYADKIYLLFIFLSMLYAMSFFQFFSTMPLFYKNSYHLRENEIGMLVAINAVLVASMEMILIYTLQHKGNKFSFIAFGALLLALCYFSLPFFHSVVWLVVINIVISFSEMFAMPFMNTFMNERSNIRNKGQYAALYAMSWSAAQVLLPVIATQTIAFSGYDMLWYLLTLISLLVAGGALWMKRRLALQEPLQER